MPTLERTEDQQVDPNSLPIEVRIIALEQALRFVMDMVKVTVTTNSPIIGAGATQTQMSLLDFYIQKLKEQQMVVGNTHGR